MNDNRPREERPVSIYILKKDIEDKKEIAIQQAVLKGLAELEKITELQIVK